VAIAAPPRIGDFLDLTGDYRVFSLAPIVTIRHDQETKKNYAPISFSEVLESATPGASRFTPTGRGKGLGCEKLPPKIGNTRPESP
jgi:hypothetical protein